MLNLHEPKYAELTRLLWEGRQTVLLVGDEGVGKKTLVRRVVNKEFTGSFLQDIAKLDIDQARRLKQESIRKAAQRRVYLIDGDQASVQAYNAMLKLLEEPPPDIYYIIAASRSPISTIVSRCSYLMIPPLTDEELKMVLSHNGMSERAVSSVFSFAHGSVTEAYRVYEKFEEKRRLVPFIQALKARDLKFVLSQVKTITKEDIALLMEVCDDVLLSRYGLMNQELGLLVQVSPDFLLLVKDALRAGNSPSLNWLRAYYATG